MSNIKLNARGERIDDEGNRLDGEGNRLDDNGEIRRNLEDELKPDEYFTNKSPILLPPIGRKDYELKISTITFVRDRQYNGLKNEDPMDHVEAFENFVENSNAEGVSREWLCCKLFPHSLTHKALGWFTRLKPGSLKNWGEVKKEFINNFFDEAKSDEIRKQISTFKQEGRETFKETWIRYSEYLKKCPHHGFTNSQAVNTFFRGLQWEHKSALDTICGGNFKGQHYDKALDVIERYAKGESANAQNDKVAALEEEVATLKKMMAQILQRTNPVANVNYVGGADHQKPMQQYHNGEYIECNGDYVAPTQIQGAPSSPDNTMLQQILEEQRKINWEIMNKLDLMNGELNDKIEMRATHLRLLETQLTQVTEALAKQNGVLPRKTNQNQMGNVSAVSIMQRPQHTKESSTEDLLELEEEEEEEEEEEGKVLPVERSTNWSKESIDPKRGNQSKEPEARSRAILKSTIKKRGYDVAATYSKEPKTPADEEYNGFAERLMMDLPFLDKRTLYPIIRKYAKEMRDEKITNAEGVELMVKEFSSHIQKNLSKKRDDPGRIELNCTINDENLEHCLCDTGSSVNIMPQELATKIGFTDLKPSAIPLRYADGSTGYSEGIIEDVVVVIDDHYIQADFHVVKMKDEPENPLILGRPFLATVDAKIYMRGRLIHFNLGEDKVLCFKMEQSKKRSTINGQAFQVETITAAKTRSAKVFDPGEVEKVIVQPEMTTIRKEPTIATKQPTLKRTIPTPPPKKKTCNQPPVALTVRSPANHVFKPPWMRQAVPTYVVRSRGPRPP